MTTSELSFSLLFLKSNNELETSAHLYRQSHALMGTVEVILGLEIRFNIVYQSHPFEGFTCMTTGSKCWFRVWLYRARRTQRTMTTANENIVDFLAPSMYQSIILCSPGFEAGPIGNLCYSSLPLMYVDEVVQPILKIDQSWLGTCLQHI